MFTNVFYQSHMMSIGGVETFLYELAKLCYNNNRDLVIIYKTGDYKQIQRLKKYCRVLKLSDVKKPIKCKNAFFNYNIDAIDDFEADNYYQVIHADFKVDPATKGLKLIQSDKIDKYFGVSKNNAESFKAITGINADVLYNPITIEKEPKIMTLLSAQRMCESKGSKRIEKMVKALDDANIPYVWHIFSTTTLNTHSENVMYHTPTLDIRKWVQYADYTVLLSDSEGFAYGLYESLCLGTPVITTPIKVLDEMGVDNTNSIVVDFGLTNLDVRDIYNRAGKFKFTYKPKSNEPWLEMIKGKSSYTPPKFVTIECTNNYFDIDLNRSVKKGEIYEVTEDRADIVCSTGYAKTVKE